MTAAWKAQARQLRIGSKAKVGHCSADRSASISNGPHGVSLYCHRCQANEFVPHPERSMAEILATRQATDALAAQAPSIPHDAVPLTQGPHEACLWVLKGGLSPEDATEKYGMCWHEKTQRVLIPIWDHRGVLVALLGRAVHGERPKYRMLSGAADSFFRAPRQESRIVCVVEDILSAIAVHRSGVNAIAVLGTAITAEHAAAIASNADTVVGWFDGDAAGDKAWVRLRSKMMLYPVTLHRISTAQDPKALHRQAIREHINSIGA